MVIRGAPQSPTGYFELSDSPDNDVFGSTGDSLGSIEQSGFDKLLGFSNSLQVHIVTGYRPANVGLVDRLGGLGTPGLGCRLRAAGPDRLRRSIAPWKGPLYFRFVCWVYSHVTGSKYYDLPHTLSMGTMVTLDYFENFVKFLIIFSEAVRRSFSALFAR